MKYLFGFILGFMACSATYDGRYLIPGFAPKIFCKRLDLIPSANEGVTAYCKTGFDTHGLQGKTGKLVFLPDGWAQ